MIDTNALLSIAFSIIANFTNAVYIPAHSVPQSTNDVEAYRVARHMYPVDVYLRHRQGTEFWIINGAVQVYYTPGTCFRLQDPSLIEKRLGPARFSSEQVLEVATNAVRRLIKSGDPLANVTPVVKPFGLYHGQTVPFYEVRWPRGKSDFVARVEVDARTGLIVALSLYDPAFQDLPFTQEITHKVYKPDPPQPKTRRKVALPRPATNVVAQAISNWLRVSQKLGIDPGGQTNLTDVDWDETFIYQSPFFSPPRPVCRITFTNDTDFHSFNGQIISTVLWDAYNTADTEARWGGKKDQLKGTIKYCWQDLAKSFERLLTTEFRIPEKALSPYRSDVGWDVPPVGTNGFARVTVSWRQWPKGKAPVSVNEVRPGLMVEFDLRTGETKLFGFRDQALIEAFMQGQAQPKHPRNQP